MLRDIRLRKFAPDSTRYGRWAADEQECTSCGELVGDDRGECQSCQAPVHLTCTVKCGKCILVVCRPRGPGWAHTCGLALVCVAAGSTEDIDKNDSEGGEMDTDAESSEAGETDEELQEEAAVELCGEDNGEVSQVPEHGLILNMSRRALHKAHEDGRRSCCGWTFRSTSATTMATWPTEKYVLCRKAGCFMEGRDGVERITGV